MTLRLHDVHKSYGGVEVLHGVSLEGAPGEVLAIVGANGAGKSTLIKILSGAVPMSSGTLSWDGTELGVHSPHDAHGIRTVHQELSLVPELSVTENLLMGNFPRRLGLIDWPAAHRRAGELLDEIGFAGIDPRTRAGRLSVPRQQMVEIAKALVSEPRVLVLDEPSAVLAGADLDALFAVIRRLQARGSWWCTCRTASPRSSSSPPGSSWSRTAASWRRPRRTPLNVITPTSDTDTAARIFELEAYAT